MPFTQEPRKGIPTSIGLVEMWVTDNTGQQADASVMARAAVLDEDGKVLRYAGPLNIGPELTATQRGQLWNIMTAIRTQATVQVIPPPAP